MGGGRPTCGIVFALAGLVALCASAAPASATVYGADVSVGGLHSGPRTPFVFAQEGELTIGAFGGKQVSAASYTGRGDVSRKGLFGRLGRFGSVALHFEQKGSPLRRRRPRRCTGGATEQLSWKGEFIGDILFHPDAGLHGYAAHDKRFEGTLQTDPNWDCDGRGGTLPFDPKAGGVAMYATDCDGLSFSAYGERHPHSRFPGDLNEAIGFSASWTKSVGAVQAQYSIEAQGGPQTFLFDDALTSGTLRPPSPFHGDARLAREGSGDWSWTGSLSVHFPGATLGLAGPRFRPIVITYEPKPSTGYIFAFSEDCEEAADPDVYRPGVPTLATVQGDG